MRKSMSKRLISTVVLTAMIAGNSTAVVYANEIKKDESVYVTLNNDGTEKEKIVSSWIHSDDSDVTVNDKSSVEDLKNVKGDEKPTQNGENLTWTLKGNDLYYQGKSSKELPVTVSIKYYLDGSEVSKEDIAGKTGKVKISLKFTNKSFEEKKIGDKMRKIYTPISVAGGMALPTDTFKNVTVTGGKVISEGSTNVVSFAVLPGMKETLDADNAGSKINVDLSDTVEVEADATNFKLGPIMMAATTMMPELDTVNAADDIDKLNDSLKQLKDASDKILDGTNKLKDGTDTAADKLADAKKMMNDPKMQEKLGLIKEDHNVLRARRLIEDALVAEGMNTSKIKDVMKLMTQGNYEKANELIKDAKALEADKNYLLGNAKKLKELADNGQVQKIVSDADNVAKAYGGMSKETKAKLISLLKDGSEKNIKMAQALLKDTLQAKNDAETLFTNRDEIKTDIASFKTDSEKVLNDAPGVLDSADNLLGTTDATLKSINSLMTDADKVMGKAGTLKADALTFESTKVNPYVAEIMKAVNAKTPEEADAKINAMIKQINDKMPEVDAMMAEIDKLYSEDEQKQLATMMSDVSDYGKAYMILKAYIISDISANIAAKQDQTTAVANALAKANVIIDSVYKDTEKVNNSQNREELKKLISKFATNPKSFDPASMFDESEKIKGYNTKITGLMSQVNGNKEKVKGIKDDLMMLKKFLPLAQEALPLLQDAKTLLARGKALDTEAQPLLQSAATLKTNAPKLIEQANGVVDSSRTLLDNSNKLMASAGKLENGAGKNANNLLIFYTKLDRIQASADMAVIQRLAATFTGLQDTELKSIDKVRTSALVLANDAAAAEKTIGEVKALAAGIKKDGKDKEVLKKVDKLSTDLTKSENLIKQLNVMMQNTNMNDVKKAAEMGNTLLSMQNDLKNSTDILRITQDALNKGNVAQARSLMNSLPKLESGIKQLSDGVTQLNDGMKKFSDEGINKLNEKGTTATGDVKDVLAVKDEMVQMSKKYDNFAGKGDNMKTSVKFVMKTDEIKAPEVKSEKTKAVTEKKTGFVEWIKNLFK